MSGLFLYMYDHLVKSKWRFILIMLLVFGPLAYLASNLRLEEDVTKMMPTDPRIDRLSKILQTSQFTDKLVFNLSLKDTGISEPDILIALGDQLVDSLKAIQPGLIKELTYEVSLDSMNALYQTMYRHLPLFMDAEDYEHIEQSLSDTAIQQTVWGIYKTLNSPASAMLKQNTLNDPLNLTPLALKKLEAVQFSDNFEMYNGRIFTKDKRHLLFYAVPANPSNETGENTRLIDSLDLYIQALSAEYHDKVVIEYFGPAAIAVANASQMKRDIQITMGLATLLLIIFIFWIYRRLSIFLLIFLPVIGGALFSLALMYVFKQQVSAIALGVGSIILGVTIDYSIHTITHFRHVTAPRKLLHDIVGPIVVCSLTTVGTLLGLQLVQAEALREMGMFSALSVIGAALVAIVILPVLLNWAKQNNSTANKDQQINKLERVLSYPFHRLKWFNLLVVVLFTFCFFRASDVGFETDMSHISYLPEHLQKAEENLDAINDYKLKQVYLLAEGQNLEEALQANEKVQHDLDSLLDAAVIDDYHSISSLLMTREEQAQRIERWNRFWTTERKQNVEERLVRHSTALGFKPDAFNGFYQWLNAPKEPGPPEAFNAITQLVLSDHISVNENSISIVNLLRLEEEQKPAIYNHFMPNPAVVVFDKKYFANKLISLIKQDFDLLVNFSFFIVLGMLLLFYGDLLLAFIVMLPVVIGWYFTLGFMNLSGQQFNIINIVISTFLYGVGIDYSVFVMRGLLQQYREGIDHLPSYKASIFTSSVTTIIGVGALFFAVHPALRSIALSVVMGTVAVVALSYTIVPAAFYWLVLRKDNTPRKAPLTLLVILDTFYIYFLVVIGGLLAPIVGFLIFIWVFIPLKKRKLAFHHFINAWGKMLILFGFQGRFKILNPHNETFDKPAVIICNHLSLLDTPSMLQLHPKLIILTNDWVRRSPVFGFATRMSDMYSVSSGIDAILPKLKELTDDGYSIVVFPEGTRSADQKLQRFHKGGFYIAEKLNLDIIPIFLQGTGYILGKTDFWGHMHKVTMQVNQRISPDDANFGEGYSKRAKLFRQYYLKEHPKFVKLHENARYTTRLLKENYRYKGFMVQWQLQNALRKEDHYEHLNKQVGANSRVAIVGAEYGFSAYMLHLLEPEREITAFIERDAHRLLAENCYYHEDKLHFQPLSDFMNGANRYDTIILEAIESANYKAVLNTLSRQLAAGGKVVVSNRYFDALAPLIKADGSPELEWEEKSFGKKYNMLILRKK